MKKTLGEDSYILKNVYPQDQVDQKIRTKYDRTIQEFRRTMKVFLGKNWFKKTISAIEKNVQVFIESD